MTRGCQGGALCCVVRRVFQAAWMGSKRTVKPSALACWTMRLHRAFGIEPSEVVAAEIVVVDVVGEHVPDRGEDRVFDGDNGFLLAESRREASVAGTEGGFAWVATTASEVDGSPDKQPHHRQPLVRPPRRHMRVIDRPVPMGIRQASPACRDCRTCCEWRLGACRKAQVGRPFHPERRLG